jgi:hypothetical protein
VGEINGLPLHFPVVAGRGGAAALFLNEVDQTVGIICLVARACSADGSMMRTHGGVISFSCPGSNSEHTGKAKAYTTAWILVPKPHGDRPIACACGPLLHAAIRRL